MIGWLYVAVYFVVGIAVVDRAGRHTELVPTVQAAADDMAEAGFLFVFAPMWPLFRGGGWSRTWDACAGPLAGAAGAETRMSADNWSVCPRCKAEAEKHYDAQAEKVQAAYGSVTVEHFDQMRGDLAQHRVDIDEFSPTFREDYSWFIDADEPGTVYGTYSGECTVCSLTAKVDVSRVFWLPEEY